MSTDVLIGLDLKCLVLSGPNGSNAYAVVKNEGAHVLVKAVIPAADPQLLKWHFVTAAWSFQESYDLSGSSASCIWNKAGELIAMGPWTGIQTDDTHTRRGFVYSPYNPLPLVEGRVTSNALWMAVDVATNINNYENEWAQLVIDTDEDDSSALEVVLTRSQISFRNLRAFGQVRELVGLGDWTLPRPLFDTSTAQLQYSNNSLFVFTAYGANDTSLMRIPFDPKSTPSSQNLTELPTGTMPIDISSTVNKCDWSDGYATALSNNKFYILCQRIENTIRSRHLFVYDYTADDLSPKLGVAVPVTGIYPTCSINVFQPLGNSTFAMLNCGGVYSGNNGMQILLMLSGPNVGGTISLTETNISVEHDTFYNNILPNQEEIRGVDTDGISSSEGVIGLVFGVLAVLAGIIFLAFRRQRRQRSKKNHEKDAETSLDSYGLQPLGSSGVASHSSHPSSAVRLIAGTAQSREANTHLSPTVYAAPQVSVPPSPAMSAGLPVSSWPTSPPTAAGASPLASATLSPAPSGGSPSGTSSGSPSGDTFQMEIQQLGFSSHPRPNFVTTVND